MLHSASEILKQLDSGDVTAVEVIGQSLAAIRASQPTINAFTHIAEETAMQAAESVDADRKAGKTLGPLAGLPVAIKDVL
ncbi:amidase family protein, partial [Rhodopirellula bahusiensis]